MFALLLSSLTGCTPQDADVSGDWFVWLAANSSATVAEGKLDRRGATVFECYHGWDAEKCKWEDGYVGKRSGGHSDSDRYIGGDCKMHNGNSNPDRRYNPAYGSCDQEYASDNCSEEDVEAFTEDCKDITEAGFHKWLGQDGYFGMTGTVEPWRSEAIINSEGDLQLTVHVDLGNRQDFRFHFTIDPDFDPVECIEDDDGDPVVSQMDKSNWVDEWSEDENGYRIFYLNTGAFQVNPNDSENWWYLSREMLAGYGFAKFAAEEFSSHPTDYGNYDIDGNGPSFLGVSDHETPNINTYQDNIEDLCDLVQGDLCIYNMTDDDGDGFTEADGDCDDATADVTPDTCPEVDPDTVPLSWQDEMVVMAGAAKNGVGQFEHKIEDNFWRPIDGTITGLDGWMELQSSWVRLKNGSKVEDGGEVSGDYQLFYDGAESGSRLLVRGEFKTTRLREDKWGYPILEDEKREENRTPYCGDARMEN